MCLLKDQSTTSKVPEGCTIINTETVWAACPDWTAKRMDNSKTYPGTTVEIQAS